MTFINDDDRANSLSWSAFRNVSFTNLTSPVLGYANANLTYIMDDRIFEQIEGAIET